MQSILFDILHNMDMERISRKMIGSEASCLGVSPGFATYRLSVLK